MRYCCVGCYRITMLVYRQDMRHVIVSHFFHLFTTYQCCGATVLLLLRTSPQIAPTYLQVSPRNAQAGVLVPGPVAAGQSYG